MTIRALTLIAGIFFHSLCDSRALASHPFPQDLLSDDIKTGLFMSSPTKGDMQLIRGREWVLHEDNLPEFEWAPSASAITSDAEWYSDLSSMPNSQEVSPTKKHGWTSLLQFFCRVGFSLTLGPMS